MKKKDSQFGKLKTVDFWKGLIVAIFTAITTSIVSIVATSTDFQSFNWQLVALSALGSFSAYISKNLLSNSDGEPFKQEN